MAQIFRVYKFEIPILIRVHGKHSHNQRRHQSHYEVLRVSPNATQKEIKEAYIKLSKEMHPDCGSKGNHTDFVKINEAYSILSKTNKRLLYDSNLKYNNISYNRNNYNYYNRNSYNYSEYPGDHNAFKGFKEYSGKYQHSTDESIRNIVSFYILVMMIGIIIWLIFIDRSRTFNRDSLLKENMMRQLEYEKLKENSKRLTIEEQAKRILELSKSYGFDPTR